ncbi:hypothetical protein KW850_12655 [Bacillus sp. sid0103]|uniref:hypothetical protein n=1 Tax=Bacillus sp. sid0103 TaxID=2856337 RepID=UPI001C464483|nr:hypothetical protein [Bacillus sp. sid0103]MBV7506107.1 hypothetical protein [Bacillus sp. sid0103]
MKFSVTGAGIDGLVASTCLAELGHMVTGIVIHTKGMIENDLILCTKTTVPVGTSHLIQQNIARRKPPNQKARMVNSLT